MLISANICIQILFNFFIISLPTQEMLKGPLDDYVKQWNGKVKVFRNKERMGLIQARNRGAELSTGDVIIFLDAHCECNRNWLVPLLARIHYDRYNSLGIFFCLLQLSN